MTTGFGPPSPDIPFSDTTSLPDDQTVAIPKTSATSQPSNDLKSDPGAGHQMATSEFATLAEKEQSTGLDVRSKISNLLKDKEQEWTAVVKKKKGPLQLLDLPLDVLKEIVKEVSLRFLRSPCIIELTTNQGYSHERLNGSRVNPFRTS
jgi:hypothetical protein